MSNQDSKPLSKADFVKQDRSKSAKVEVLKDTKSLKVTRLADGTIRKDHKLKPMKFAPAAKE